jgi:arylsulfatase A-like enzyme/Flp pilus assembly protein TadD
MIRLLALTLLLWDAALVYGKQPPDVFLVTIDTLRADHVHCYGYDRVQTPALDALARDGFRFTEAFTPSPLTNTSHTTILTGLLPSSHGVTDFAVPLDDSHLTLADLLKAQGYKTAAFIGAIILDSHTLAPGLDRGFDFYDNFPAKPAGRSPWNRLERRGMTVVQHAEAWLRAHPAGPRFVWVHLYDPHDPYEPPAPYSQTYQDRPYDGEIAYADSALGNLVSYLKQRGWYENSLVVVVGDHGEGLGEHGENTHGIFLYDSTTHVPLIVKPPAGAQGRVVEAQVRTTDIVPTVLDFAAASKPDRLDGETLLPFLHGEDSAERTALGETDYPLRFGWSPLRAVRAKGFKFIEAPRPELYNLGADPGELKNTYEPWNETVKDFRAVLAEVRASSPARSSAGSVGQGTVDELKALGYLGPADAGSSTNVPEPSLLPDPKDKIEEQNLLHTAMMASQRGQLAEAQQALEQVLARDEKSAIALRQLGEVELQSGDSQQAASHLRKASAAAPDDAAVGFLLGQALQKIGDFEGARAALEASLKLRPNEPLARFQLGRVFLDLKNYDAAADQFEAGLILAPSSLDGQLGVARAQIGLKNFTDAVHLLTRLAKAEPGNKEVAELLAKARREKQ